MPEVKTAVAHGQMAPSVLEDVMTAFYERKIDVLVSTNIVESGLDIPTANTHDRAARRHVRPVAALPDARPHRPLQARAYAYLTTPADKKLTDTATRRLEVLQSLDQLGAGFSVASHDMDIRGAGNLLGEEQSGHVREVGIELYQEMLEEAVSQLREGGDGGEIADQWSPHHQSGRLGADPGRLCRRPQCAHVALSPAVAGIETRADIDALRRRTDRPFRPAAGRGASICSRSWRSSSWPHGAGWRRSMPAPRAAPSPSATMPSPIPLALIQFISQHRRHHEGAARPEDRGHPRLAHAG